VQHKIKEMTKRSIACGCGRVLRISEVEAEGYRQEKIDDMLLDRHSDHVLSMKEQGK
jgi:hypothetical protein